MPEDIDMGMLKLLIPPPPETLHIPLAQDTSPPPPLNTFMVFRRLNIPKSPAFACAAKARSTITKGR